MPSALKIAACLGGEGPNGSGYAWVLRNPTSLSIMAGKKSWEYVTA